MNASDDELLWKPGWILPMVRWVAEAFFPAWYLADAEILSVPVPEKPEENRIEETR